MIKLGKNNNVLELSFSGLDSDAFSECLQKARSVPGRRWNPEKKVNEYPADYMVASRIIHLMNPELDAECLSWFRSAKAEAAEAVTTKLPDDAEIGLPWSSRLYPYQRAGIEFLCSNPKAILADDMGLGKTIQAISTVKLQPLFGPKLVICPNSVKGVWEREIGRWTGDVATVVDGKTAIKRSQQVQRAARDSKWIILNWEKLRLMPELQTIKWAAIVADEAHRAKNRKAQQTKALWKLDAPLKLALTGTPIQNSPDELWAILKWLYPKEYTSYWRFFEQYVDYHEGHFGKIITGVKNADFLRFELADKLVRRTKGSVLDLPEKVRTTVPVSLSPYQRKLYAEAEQQLWLEIKKEAESGSNEARKLLSDPSLIFMLPNGAARTVRLRQILSTPQLLGGKDESAKLDAAVEIIGDMPPDKKVVVFSQFKGTIEALHSRLVRQGFQVAAITGDTPPSKRDEAVSAFQDDPFVKVFASTQATGGVGLTLTAADTAIFIERDWVPANNEQAEDRLHRIGQGNSVNIIILEASDTLDDGKVADTNRRKENVVESVIEKDRVNERNS